MILRDNNGKVIMTASKKEQAVVDSFEIELLAILRGLQLSISLEFQEIHVESNSLLMVKEITDSVTSSSILGNIVKYI